MSNDFAATLALLKGGLRDQPHPEFDFDYVAALVEAKPWAFPADQPLRSWTMRRVTFKT